MTSVNPDRRRGRVVIGVDTHKYVHAAVALDDFGGVLGAEKFSADAAGYEELIDWAARSGHLLTFAIEGTGSYSAGLTAAVRRRDIGVIEVMPTDRRDRRLRGKSNFLDAENAARAVFTGNANAVPKTTDGVVEMIRTIKVAKDVAVKARTPSLRRVASRYRHYGRGSYQTHAAVDRTALAATQHRDHRPRETPRRTHHRDITPSRSTPNPPGPDSAALHPSPHPQG